jgi:hypothetical protein
MTKSSPRSIKSFLTSATLALALAACAGRSPNPVPVIQPTDSFADCTALLFEANANNQRMQDLAGDPGAKVAQNVAAGVVGLFVWPVWFAMDFQGSAGIEISALQARNQYLAARAAEKHCTGGPAVAARP